MSQTTRNPPTATFNDPIYQAYVHEIQEDLGTFGLLVGLYSIFIALSLLSTYILVTRCTRKTRRTTIMLSSIIFTLLASTTIYTVTWILARQTDFLRFLIDSAAMLWSEDNIDTPFVEEGWGPITLGDAIVCWRACVVWHGSIAVKVAYSVFLMSTFVLGAMDTAVGCNAPSTLVPKPAGFMYEGIPPGLAASVLSLSTNFLATILVGYKAWESRTSLRGYIVAGPRTTQVTKLFTLLIESGAMCSTFWAIIVAFQIGQYMFVEVLNSNYQKGFFDVVGVIMNGALVPLIAFYPSIIVIIVALNRSHMERGFLRHAQSFSLPTLPITLETSTANRHGSRWSQRVAELRVLNEAHFECRDGLGDARGPRPSREQKVGEIV